MSRQNILPNSNAYPNMSGKSASSNFRTLHVSPKACNSVFQLMHAHDKWPFKIENAFTSALRTIIKTGTSKIKIRNKNYGRNELISLYIKYETGELRTKKQISSHIQVWKKSILNKISNHMYLTPFDTEMLHLIERGAEQNEKTISHFYALFEKIIDTLSKSETGATTASTPSPAAATIKGVRPVLISGSSGLSAQEATVSDSNSTASTGVFSAASVSGTDISTDFSGSDTSTEAAGRRPTSTRPGEAGAHKSASLSIHHYHDYVPGTQFGYGTGIFAKQTEKPSAGFNGNNYSRNNSTITAELKSIPSHNSRPCYSLEDVPYNQGAVMTPCLSDIPAQSTLLSTKRVVSNPEMTGLASSTMLPRPSLKRLIDSDFTTVNYDTNAKRIKLPPIYRNSSKASSSASLSATSSRVPSGASTTSSSSSSSGSSSIASGLDSPIDPKSVILPSLYQPVYQTSTSLDTYPHSQTMLLRGKSGTTQIFSAPKLQTTSRPYTQPTTSVATATQRRFSRGGLDILPPLQNMKLRGENRGVTLRIPEFGGQRLTVAVAGVPPPVTTTTTTTAVAPVTLMPAETGISRLAEMKRGL